ncbi:HIT family protein [Candidatus Uhrbacteria bacterium]|nr:HIT family protein [Candidatus Uhrbacteria bacterium]
MAECIFCKIIRGEIPSHKIYEDERIFAFLDIAPVSLGHTLVVPKAHAENVLQTPDEHLSPLFPAVKKIAAAALAATGAGGFNIGVNCGKAAGQVVFHTHIHVIPRFENDGLKLWPKRPVTPEEMIAVAEKIVAALA